MSRGRTGVPNKLSLLAKNDLDRLGLNPIEELHRCIQELKELKEEALKAYKEMRGYGEKSDAGTQYLANAIKAVSDQAVIANNLAKFKHPTLSAIAMKDVSDTSGAKDPMTTAQAIETLKADPFSPQSLKEIPTERILDAMTTTLNAPFLPMGNADAKPD